MKFPIILELFFYGSKKKCWSKGNNECGWKVNYLSAIAMDEGGMEVVGSFLADFRIVQFIIVEPLDNANSPVLVNLSSPARGRHPYVDWCANWIVCAV